MISTAPPSSATTTPTLMATNKKSTRASQQSVGSAAAAMAPPKKMVVMKANGRHQQQHTTPTGTEVDRMHSMDIAAPIPLRRVSHAFDQQQQNHHHQSAKILSAPPGYQHQMTTGVFNQPLNTTPTVAVSHNADSSDCGSSSGLGGMGTPVKGEEGCSASCSTSSNNSMAADCSFNSHDRDSAGLIRPEESTGAEDCRESSAVSNGHRSLLASATLTPSMVSSSLHSAPVSASMAPIFQSSATPQQQMVQQQPPFSAFVSPIPLLSTQSNSSQINALHCSVSDGPSPLMAPPMPRATVGTVPYAVAANFGGRTSSASTAAAVATGGDGGGALPSPAALMSKTGLKQLHPPPPLSGRALYTMTCETDALASVSAAALTAGYHVTLDPSASAPPIITTVAATASAGAEFVAATCENNNEPLQHNDASPHDQKDENGTSAAMNDVSSGVDRSMGNGPTIAGSTTVNLPPGVPPEIAAAISGGNDLFVHIHPGDAIALAVGNDIQHIHGPATIRMVSQSATPQSAIPMNVPEGHIVQQILDRQGHLSHIIMSQEGMPPVGVGRILGQHVIATGAMSQMPSTGPLPMPSTTQMQQRSMGFQPHPSAATVPLKHFHSTNSPPDASAPSDGVPLSRHKQQQQQGMSTDSGAVYPSGVVPLLKWSDLQQNHGHPQQRDHYQSQNGPYGKQQHGRGHPAASSPSGVYHLTDSASVSAHYQPRHSPGFYVQGSSPMVGLDNRGCSDTSPNVAYHQSQQQQQTANNATNSFDAVNLPPQISTIIEDDEKERLRDTLSALQAPTLSRVGDRDAEVIWQEIDTSEAAASGGPFPQIDPSEFVYQLTLLDVATHSQTFYKTGAAVNVLHLQKLSPGTEYMVAVCAELPERNIKGHPSTYTSFRTSSAVPEAPSMPKLVGRQQNCLSFQWKSPNCNGAPILSYCLQMAKGKMAAFETVYEGSHEQTVTSGLDGGTLCRFRVFARNELGQSESSPILTVYPERSENGGRPPAHHHNHHLQQQHHQQQQHSQHGTTAQRGGSLAGYSAVSPTVTLSTHHHQSQPIRPPHPPNVYSTAARAIKLSWNPLSGADFTSLALEMADPSNVRGSTLFQAVSPECYANSGTFAHIPGLFANREYRFRLAAMTAAGDVLYSESISARTRHEQQSSSAVSSVYNKERRVLDGGHHHQYVQHHHNDNKGLPSTQMARTSILGHDSTDHHQQQQNHQPIGQSLPPQKMTVPSNLSSSLSKKQPKAVQQKPLQQSAEDQSEDAATHPAVTQPSPKAPNCSAPAFSALTSESARVVWKLVKHVTITDGEMGSTKGTANGCGDNYAKSASLSSSSALIFELQRVDKQQPMMVYSGIGAEFDYKGLRPVEHLQLRVRAVLLDTEGCRLEGDWSPVGSTCTLCAPPSAPQNLRFAAEGDTLCNGHSSTKTTNAAATTVSNDGSQWHSVAICWDAPAQLNGATVGEYAIRIQRFDLPSAGAKAMDSVSEKPSDEQTQHISGAECRFTAHRLRPAQLFRFTVTAQSDAGPSPKSEVLEYRSPPGVPGKPRDVHVEALSTTELQLSWAEPSSANGSPIVSYHVNCFKLSTSSRHQQQHDTSTGAAPSTSSSSSRRQLVSQQIAPSSQRLLIIQSLEAETDYELIIQAENSVGKGDRTIVQHKTLVVPPEAPQLSLAQATANSLKLKWNADGGDSNGNNFYYYLERENENGTYSPVYEGELRTARLKGLREQSVHHFRIRASVAKGLLQGPWSRRFSFQTTKLPPPAPKQAPTVVEQSQDHFQFEWNSVRFREQNGAGGDESPLDGGEQQHRSEFFYRLQMALKVGSSVKEKSAVEVWKNIFEDKTTQTPPIYVYNASQQPRQVRLFVVQRCVDASGKTIEELVSAPSPVAVFSSLKTPNESPRKRNFQSQQGTSGGTGGRSGVAVVGRKSTNPYPLPKETKMSFGKKMRRIASWLRKTVSEKDCALIVLAIFVLLAFGIAILLNNFYLN